METEQSTLVTLATKLLGMRRGCVRTLDCGLKVSHTARKKPFWVINWSLPNHKTDCRDGRDCKTGSSIYLHFPDRDSKSKAQRQEIQR